MRFVKVISESTQKTIKKLERNCVACCKAISAPYETEKTDKIKNTAKKSIYAGFSFNNISAAFKNKVSAFAGKVNKKAFSSAATVVSVILLMILFNANFSFAYSAFLDGVDLGFVPNKEYVQSSVDSINNEFSAYVSGEKIIDGRAVFAPAIIKKNSFTEKNVLEEKIKSTSDIMVEAFAIEVGGRVCSSLETRDEAESVVNSVLSSFMNENTTEVYFYDEVSTVSQFVPASTVMSAPDAAEVLKGSTSVVAKDTLSYETTVPFNEEILEDDSMYQGAEKILQKGTNGTNEITEEVVRIDGQVESRTVLSNVSITAPQTQLRATGTMERPYYMGTGTFLRPYYGTVSSRFGSRRSGHHTGVDFCGPKGDPIIAADTGTVIFSDWSGGYGNVVKIDHHNGYITYYAHCSSLNVEVGDVVKKGQTIATVGSTGNSTGPHLHFEIRYNGEAVNPMNYVD